MIAKLRTQKSTFLLLSIVLLLFAWSLLIFRIGGAWLGHQDANGAWISTSLRNYERYGFFTLSGMVTLDTQPEINDPPRYYVRHPPIAVWVAYPLIAVSGFQEALVRIVYIGCTLISAAALTALAQRLFKQGELWALAFYLFTPMMLYFGRMPDHEAPALMLALLLAVVLVNWIRRPTRKQYITAALLMITLGWTAWGGLIIGFTLCGALLIAYRQRCRGLLGVIALGGFAGLSVILFYQSVWPETIQELIEFFIWRTSNASGLPETTSFTAGEFFIRLALRFLTLYTPTIFVFAIIGLWRIRHLQRQPVSIICGLLFGALGFIFLFRNASYIHDYYLIYFAPTLALLSTATILWSQQHIRFRRWLRPAITAFLLLWPVFVLANLDRLFAGSLSAEPLRFAETLDLYTQPEDMIASNLPNYGMATEFYAERTIIWEMEPEAIPTVDRSNGPLFYLYCGERSELDTLSSDEVIDVFSPCWLARFD